MVGQGARRSGRELCFAWCGGSGFWVLVFHFRFKFVPSHSHLCNLFCWVGSLRVMKCPGAELVNDSVVVVYSCYALCPTLPLPCISNRLSCYFPF
jgi:hypothetical protein